MTDHQDGLTFWLASAVRAACDCEPVSSSPAKMFTFLVFFASYGNLVKRCNETNGVPEGLHKPRGKVVTAARDRCRGSDAPTPLSPSPFLSPGGASPSAVIGWEHSTLGRGVVFWEQDDRKATTAGCVLESVTRRKRA